MYGNSISLFLAQFLGNGSEEYHSNYNPHKHPCLALHTFFRVEDAPTSFCPQGAIPLLPHRQAACPSEAHHVPDHVSSVHGLSEPWKSLIVQPEACYIYSSSENCLSPCFWGTRGLSLHKIWKLLCNIAETAEGALGTIKIEKLYTLNLAKAARPGIYKKREIKIVCGDLSDWVTLWETPPLSEELS